MSMAGTATMLMLEPEAGYAAEVVMFGGYTRGRPQCECDVPSNAFAHRIRLDKKTVDDNRLAWQREAMPYGRNMNDCVLLPNGQIIIVNGARTGVISNARNPAHDAWLYDPKAPAGQRFRTLAATNINRYYHSTALLLPDASILVMGSEYGTCTASCARPTPWRFQHQAERFLPPYFFGTSRPSISSTSASVLRYHETLNITFSGSADGAVLMTPAAVTHQNNMNQRAVKLVVTSNADGVVRVSMPPNQYIAPPGWHMLFLMNGDVPCLQASWLRLRL
ncbi:immunoglobulin E-set [Scenedesmus sp. NREL 46B-D3]|nr:immunoglobulin E-set [Scenedesmus sp. NREL 46B-D3]